MVNFTCALRATAKGRMMVADIDFTSPAYSMQTTPVPKPYFNSGIWGVLNSQINLAFPQVDKFSSKGLRYFYRPFYLGGTQGDTPDAMAGVTPPHQINFVPSVFVYNNNNNNTENIGLSRTDFDNYWSTTGTSWVSRIMSQTVIGAANFEWSFQDNVDVTQIATDISGTVISCGRILLQFTEFEVEPFCKTTSIGFSTI